MFLKFYGSRGLVFLAVMCLAVSIFIQSSLGVSIFCKPANGLEVSIRSFVFINEVLSSLLTTSLWRQRNGSFAQRCQNVVFFSRISSSIFFAAAGKKAKRGIRKPHNPR